MSKISLLSSVGSLICNFHWSNKNVHKYKIQYCAIMYKVYNKLYNKLYMITAFRITITQNRTTLNKLLYSSGLSLFNPLTTNVPIT